ncbi:MAG: hypothetical protein JO252_07290, partial [Planctomycetaceae bacterium]|nr:hypothetical protein [Planctomycetaceae bacterium]
EAILFRSGRAVDRWLKRSQAEGVEGVTTKTPRDFGFLRGRWSCAILAPLLRDRQGVTASRETVRRWPQRGHLVYRRPLPVLQPDEEERRAKLAELRKLQDGLPDDETAVWQDEVEIHTNPKLGQMRMLNGQQAKVEMPGTNTKRHPSGSIPWRTGQVFVTEAAPKQGRDGALFLKHPDDPRRRLRRYKKFHVIGGNASGHTGLEVIQYLWT